MEEILNINFNLNKKERLLCYESKPTHAMVITGYNINDSIINRWQIENSWGENKEEGNEENNYEGYYSMTDKWMKEYVFEIIINKKYLSNDIKKMEPGNTTLFTIMGSIWCSFLYIYIYFF